MKYSLIFAATAAASNAYGGNGYDGHVTSVYAVSTPVSTPAAKSTPCTTDKAGYTTVTPGYGKSPVTVTTQHQPYPTCASAGYDGKSCDKWEDQVYVSTVIKDCNSKDVTVTDTKQTVTVYYTKSTITHSATPTWANGGYAAPTGSAYKNSTGVWYELYEKANVVEYKNLGSNAIPGYGGSGLCNACNTNQPYIEKEYKGGKWTESHKEMSYEKPEEKIVYEKPGVYTVPAKDYTYNNVVYHRESKTVTVTVANQAYTCQYQATATPSMTKGSGYAHPTTTAVYNNGYEASATPKKPTEEYGDYPSYPAKVNSTSYAYGGHGGYTSTPVVPASSTAYYGDNGYASSAVSASTPCSTPVHPTASAPAYDNSPAYATSASAPPAYATPVYSAPAAYDNTPAHSTPASAPPAYATPAYSAPAAYDNTPAHSAPAAYSTPVYSAPAAYATPSAAYDSSNPTYAKRDSMVERRRAAAEKRAA